MARFSRHLVSQVVAVSPAARDEAIRAARFRPERVLIIPNGVDTERYLPSDGRAARESLGLSKCSLVVGGVGRLATAKGFGDLLEALAILRRDGLEVQLALVGDGPEADQLHQKSQALGISEHVKFLGARSDLVSIYPAFDVFVLPSLEEGSPMALLEAMASGCATIATCVGGVPEIVEPERSGLLVGPGSPSQLADALYRLYQDSNLRDKLGVEARARVESKFALSQTVETYEKVYLSICR